MDSEHNPHLANILRALKNPLEAGTQQQIRPNSIGHILPSSTMSAFETTPQVIRPPAITESCQKPITLSVDPSKITTWAPAQKYVIDNIYGNQAQASRIKQIISNQQGHEKQWWVEREALISKHRTRVEKEKQVAAILQSMGGIAGSTKSVDVGEEEAELRRCDLKIHKAMTKLATDIDRELRSMGIPFYAIKHELVILEERKHEGEQLGKLDKAGLKALQKRMLQLLGELLKE